MKKHGILNSQIAKVVDDFGHMDMVTIGDMGLPVPATVPKIDLAVKMGEPKFLTVLTDYLQHVEVEKVILAEEIKTQNETMLTEIKRFLPEQVEIEYISHRLFKEKTNETKAVIRTGEATPYANIILVSGVIF